MATSGISLPPLLGNFTATSNPVSINSGADVNTGANGAAAGEWTPPQYALPALTILTVPATTSNTSGQASSIATNYVFDAVLRVVHRRTLHKTQHPVLTGANVSDHAYMMPTRVTLEIGMSDAMAAYAAGVWVGAVTKSVSAWQILKQLQLSKTLLTLTTRLDNYTNMLIMEMDAPDDNKTRTGLRSTIVLEEIVAGSVSSTAAVSARPQTTGSTSNGTVQSTPVNPSQAQNNVIPSTAFPDVATHDSVPGAGLGSAGTNSVGVSSNNLGQAPED